MPKDRIRKRRRLRIQQLKENSQYAVQPPQSMHLERKTKKLDRWDDPEYVWKNQPPPWTTDDHSYVDDHDRRFASNKVRRWKLKLAVSCLLLALTTVLFQFNQPWALHGQLWVKQALTEHADFEPILTWYENTFQGSPSFIPVYTLRKQEATKVNLEAKESFEVPVQGKIVVPFSTNREGIHIQPNESGFVHAIDEGRVIFSGHNERTGITVIVQHPGEIRSVYGQLGETKMHKNDWVKAGDAIGTIKEDSGKLAPLYFALTLKGTFQNPVEVIAFD